MHILFISDMDTKYGALQGLWQLVEGLRKYYPETEISVIVPKSIRPRKRKENKKNATEFQEIGCKVFQVYYDACIQVIPANRCMLLLKYPLKLLKYLFGRYYTVNELGRKMDWGTVDIVHSNSSREDLGAALALKYHKPLIWHIREFGDLDYPCYSYRRNYIAYMNEHADLFLSVSDAIRKHWIDKGIEANKIKTIYDGIDERVMPHTDDSFDPERELRFVMLGSVQETKGQLRLIEALGMVAKEKLDRFHVDIVGGVGSEDYLKSLKKRISELHLKDQISLLGYQEHFREKLSAYDCGLMCSRSEAFGFVTVEYMAAGLPVIAAATGANPELVMDGKVGFLYDPKNPKNLAERIEALIDHPERCIQMGHEAAKYARETFSLQRSVENIHREYETILGKQ